MQTTLDQSLSQSENLNEKAKHLSSLYQFIDDLRSSIDKDIQEMEGAKLFSVTESNQRPAYFINIPQDISIQLLTEDTQWAGYALAERHFSVDKWYNKPQSEQNFLTFMHYTEAYYSKEAKNYLIAHVYLNHQGNILHTHIKLANESKKFLNEVTLNDALLSKLKANYSSAIPVIELLITKRLNTIAILLQETNTLEEELTRYSKVLWMSGNSDTSSQTIEKYIETAHKFIQTINRLNRYCDQKDQRGKIIESVINGLKVTTTEEAPEQTHEARSDTSVATATTVVPRKINNQPDQTGLLAEINGFISNLSVKIQYNENKLKDVLEREEVVTQALILIHSTMIRGDYQHLKDSIPALDKLFALVHDHKNKAKTFLKKSLLAGNIFESISSLFTAYKEYLDKAFCQELITNLVTIERDKKALIKSCNYLHEHYENFHNIVYELSNTLSFDLSSLKEKNFYSISELGAMEKSSGSLLFKAYVSNKEDIFTLLLQYGANPNSWGFKNNYLGGRNISIIYCIANLRIKNYAYYIKQLIEHHAEPNLIDIDNHWFLRTKLRATKTALPLMKQLSKQHAKPLSLKFDIMRGSPLLLFIISGKDEALINLLGPLSTPTDLAYVITAISQLSTVQSSSYYDGFFDSPATEIYSNGEQAQAAIQLCQLDIIEFMQVPFYRQYLFPRDPNDIKSQTDIKHLNILFSAFLKKINNTNYDSFCTIYQSLIEWGQNRVNFELEGTALAAFKAAVFLIINYYQKLSAQQKKNIINEKMIPLYKYLIELLSDLIKQSKYPEFTQFYSGELKLYTSCLNAGLDKNSIFWKHLEYQIHQEAKATKANQNQDQISITENNSAFWKKKEEDGYGPGAIIPYQPPHTYLTKQ